MQCLESNREAAHRRRLPVRAKVRQQDHPNARDDDRAPRHHARRPLGERQERVRADAAEVRLQC